MTRSVRFVGNLLRVVAATGLVFHVSLAAATSVNEYLEDAGDYLAKGEVNAAIIQYKNALKQAPKNAEARFLLGEAYLLKGDPQGAEKELSRAKRLGYDANKVMVPLARAYLMLGKPEQAKAELTLGDSVPADVQVNVHVLRAQIHLMSGEKPKALEEFDAALKLQADAADALLGKARLAMLDKRTDDALALIARVTAAQPDNVEALTLKGEILRQKNDMAAAGKAFAAAVKARPTYLPALLGQVTTAIALGERAAAEDALQKIFKVVPNHPIANHFKALLLVMDGKPREAEGLLQDVLSVAPDYVPSQQLMGSIYYANGQYEQAEYLLNRVVNAAPGNLSARKLLAAVNVKLEQPGKAIELLESIPQPPEDDAQYYGLLGSAYMRQDKLEKGMAYLEKAAEIAPDEAKIRTQLALGHLVTGDASGAVKELETAVDLEKNVYQADVLLIMVHLRKKDFDKALEQAEAFGKKLPESPLPDNFAGTAYIGLGDHARALKRFEAALAKDRKFTPAEMNLARLSEAEGNRDKAREHYRQVLKINPAHERALLSLARLAGQAGDEKGMRELLESAWAKNEGSLRSGLALVDYYTRSKQNLRAVGIARELKNKHPKQPVVYRALGIAQMQAKDYHNAKGTFAAWASLDAKSPEAVYLQGQAERALDELKKARESYTKALALAADYLPAQLAMASLHANDKNYKAALAIAGEIQKQRPKHPAGYRLEGDIFMKMSKFGKAQKAYDRGLAKAPAAVLAINAYTARKKAGKKKAYQPLIAWLESHPEDGSVRLALASAYQDNQALEKAASEYRRLLKQAPNNVVVLNNLAWIAHALGQSDALQLAQRAYDAAPETPAVMDTYGWLLVKNKQTKRGVDILQQAVSLAPHMAEIRYHYGVGLHELGRNKEAKAELARALDISKEFSGAKQARILMEKM